jgi:hypothetical protein
LSIGSDDEDITERVGRLSRSPEPRRSDAIVVGDENERRRFSAFRHTAMIARLSVLHNCPVAMMVRVVSERKCVVSRPDPRWLSQKVKA